MSRSWLPSKEQEQLIINGYASPDISIRELAKELGIGKDTLMRYADKNNLVKVPKDKLNAMQRKAIDDWKGEISLNELANNIGLSLAGVQKRMKKLGIDTKQYIEKNPHYRPGKTPRDEAFFKDIDNPKYSSIELAEKYGVSDVAIQRWRKKRHGKFKPQLDTSTHLTTPERRVKELLDELDIVYFTHHVIEGWNVDFYLGHKLAIEVNGTYWHGKEKNMRKDVRKLTELMDKGYRVLTINYDKKTDFKMVKKQIQKFWVTHISNGM